MNSQFISKLFFFFVFFCFLYGIFTVYCFNSQHIGLTFLFDHFYWDVNFRLRVNGTNDQPWMSGLISRKTHDKRLPDRTHHCDWMMLLHDHRAHGGRNSHDGQTTVDFSFGRKITPTRDPSCNRLPGFLLGWSHNSWYVLQNKTKYPAGGRATAQLYYLLV